jgi:hypothetical protein
MLGACASVPDPAPIAQSGVSASPVSSVESAPAPALAASSSVDQALPAPTTVVEAAQQAAESTRRSARSTAEWLARGVDGWFGDRPFEDGGKVTDGRLSLGLLKRESAKTDVDVRFTAHFRLPNIEQRAYLFIGRDNPRDAVRDTPETFSDRQRLQAQGPTDRSLLVGLGLSLRNAVDFRLGLGPGAKPYAQARYDQPWEFAPGHLVDFRETVFWTNADRFGSTTALSYETALSPTLALRWLNAATITEVSKNFEWSSGLGAYKSLGMQRLFSLEALFNGTGTHGSGVGLSDMGVLARWEQPIYEKWLLGEIVGGHFWPRRDTASERTSVWAIGGSLKMRF